MNKKQTIIAPGIAKKDILKHLAKEDDLLMGVEILPLNVYKDNLVSYLESKETEFVRLFNKVHKEISKTNVYYNTLQFPSFFNYFYECINDLVDNNININNLPDDDSKEILLWLYNQPLRSKKINEAFNSIEDASDVLIYDCFYNNKKDVDDLDFLKTKGAKSLTIEKEKTSKIAIKYAKNNSQEISAVAQYLINNEKINLNDVVLLVNNLKDNYPIIHHVLSLYDIPHSVNAPSKSESAQQFVSLIKFMNKKDIDSFLEAYNTGIFGHEDVVLVEYIDYLDLTYEQLFEPLNYIRSWKDETELCHPSIYKNMVTSEEKSEQIMEGIRDILNHLPYSGTIKEKTSAAFDLICANSKERECLDDIRSLCLNVVPELDDSDKSYELLYWMLERINRQSSERIEEGLQISGVYKNITDKKIAIVLGCTQKQFPETVNKTGFFDERYLAQIEGYPTLEERDDFFNRQLEYLFDSYPEIIFSYPTNDLEGHKLYKSVYLDKFNIEHEAWPYDEINRYKNKTASLSQDTAKKLFLANKTYLDNLKDRYEENYKKEFNNTDKDTIVISASSLQQYVGCHFKYYLDKGLKLKAKQWFDIEANTSGNIMHKSLEKYYKDNKKDDIEKLIKEHFASLRKLFINRNKQIDLIEKRTLENLRHKMTFLNKAIDKAKWKPSGYELPVIHSLDFDKYQAIINGSIDRLDSDPKDKEFMIVDYKSSNKEIKKDEVYNGKNVQLLTYLLAYAKEKEEEKAVGMSYYNLRPDDIDLKSKEIEAMREMNDEKLREFFENKRREEDRYSTYLLEGNTTSDINYKINKFAPQEEHYENVIETIIKEVTERILSGDISIDPRNDACKYCDYKNICHSYVKESAASEAIYIETQEMEETENDIA